MSDSFVNLTMFFLLDTWLQPFVNAAVILRTVKTFTHGVVGRTKGPEFESHLERFVFFSINKICAKKVGICLNKVLPIRKPTQKADDKDT